MFLSATGICPLIDTPMTPFYSTTTILGLTRQGQRTISRLCRRFLGLPNAQEIVVWWSKQTFGMRIFSISWIGMKWLDNHLSDFEMYHLADVEIKEVSLDFLLDYCKAMHNTYLWSVYLQSFQFRNHPARCYCLVEHTKWKSCCKNLKHRSNLFSIKIILTGTLNSSWHIVKFISVVGE